MDQHRITFTVAAPARVAAALAIVASAAASQLVFEPPVLAETAVYAQRTFAADIDEDGQLDLVTSRLQGFLYMPWGKPTLSRGLGGGQFAPPAEIPVGPATLPGLVLGLADFDADGHLDLLAGQAGAADKQAVSVMLGDGHGAFGPALGISNTNSGQDPDCADVGDFNADGALDVAVYRGEEGFLVGRIMVILGHGDGSFDEPLIPVPFTGLQFGQTGVLRVGDVNGDGLDDIVYTTGHNSQALLSAGDGTFVLVAACPSCGLTTDRDFVLADVDADGDLDVVSNLRVLLGDGHGAFAAGQVFPAAFFPQAVAVADFDADGTLDAALGRNGIASQADATSVAGDVLLLAGLGDGSLAAPGVVVSHVPQPRGLEVADFDGDGRPDLVAAEFQVAHAGRVLLNRTYVPGSPYLDLGGALGGANGFPIQLAAGTLQAGQPFSFRLASGPPGGAAYHLVGLSAINAPFKGGSMIPMPQLINGPIPLDGAGGVTLAGNWLSGTSGLTLWLQFWMPNGGGPHGFVASSGVRAQVP